MKTQNTLRTRTYTPDIYKFNLETTLLKINTLGFYISNDIPTKEEEMKTKYIFGVLLTLLMISNITLLASVHAVVWPSLPPGTVQLSVVHGTLSTDPYFISTLSGVPAGYDVTNKAYPGWCIDMWAIMDPGSHNVKLYSSLFPPPALSGLNWNAINYILNHKVGTRDDIQHAIWYFTDGRGYTGDTPVETMVNGALANPSYVPTTGEVLAVICLALMDQEWERAQDSIIELVVPPRQEAGYTPGFWKHNIGVALGYNKGAYSAFNDGTKLTKAMLEGYATIVGVTLQEAYTALTTMGGPPNDAIRNNMANAFNAAAGYGPF